MKKCIKKGIIKHNKAVKCAEFNEFETPAFIIVNFEFYITLFDSLNV